MSIETEKNHISHNAIESSVAVFCNWKTHTHTSFGWFGAVTQWTEKMRVINLSMNHIRNTSFNPMFRTNANKTPRPIEMRNGAGFFCYFVSIQCVNGVSCCARVTSIDDKSSVDWRQTFMHKWCELRNESRRRNQFVNVFIVTGCELAKCSEIEMCASIVCSINSCLATRKRKSILAIRDGAPLYKTHTKTRGGGGTILFTWQFN